MHAAENDEPDPVGEEFVASAVNTDEALSAAGDEEPPEDDPGKEPTTVDGPLRAPRSPTLRVTEVRPSESSDAPLVVEPKRRGGRGRRAPTARGLSG